MASRFTSEKRMKIKKYAEARRQKSMKFGKSFFHSYNPLGYVVSDSDKDKDKYIPYSLGTRARAGAVIDSDYLLKMFPEHKSLDTKDKIIAKAAVGYPRAIVLLKIENGIDDERAPVFVNSVLEQTKHRKVTVFISGELAFFIREDIYGHKKKIRKSLLFHNLQLAMQAYNFKMIRYVEPPIEVLISPPPVDT